MLLVHHYLNHEPQLTMLLTYFSPRLVVVVPVAVFATPHAIAQLSRTDSSRPSSECVQNARPNYQIRCPPAYMTTRPAANHVTSRFPRNLHVVGSLLPVYKCLQLL